MTYDMDIYYMYNIIHLLLIDRKTEKQFNKSKPIDNHSGMLDISPIFVSLFYSGASLLSYISEPSCPFSIQG